jgi:hypothetical protein
VIHDLWTLLGKVISYVFVIKKAHINMCPILDGYRVTGNFISRTRPRVNRVLRSQLAGDVLNLVAYRLRCKQYFCHLTRPPSQGQSSSRISTLAGYVRKAGSLGIRLASVHWMTQQILRALKPLSYCSDCAGSKWSEQYGYSFVKAWAVDATYCRLLLSPVRILISVGLLRSRYHLHFQLQSMQMWFMCTVFVTVIQLMP